LQPLVLAAEQTLQLDEDKRRRTLVRLDAGGGSLDDVNWPLSRGYLVHCKDYSGQQAKRLAKSVQDWYVDLHLPERQFGWVTETADASVRPVKRLAVRCRKLDGKFAYGVLISTLSAQHVLVLTGQPLSLLDDPAAVRLSYVTFYDQRGGRHRNLLQGRQAGIGHDHPQQKTLCREAYGHEASQPGAQCDRLGPSLVGKPDLATLRDVAHGA